MKVNKEMDVKIIVDDFGWYDLLINGHVADSCYTETEDSYPFSEWVGEVFEFNVDHPIATDRFIAEYLVEERYED